MNDACRFSFYRQPSPPENPSPILSLDEDELVAAAAAAFVCPPGGCVGGANKSVDTPCKPALDTISLVDIFRKRT